MNTRGVILAGGTGSRLGTLAAVTNKHLLPIGREPMICHPVRKLVQAGIDRIMVVTGTEHAGAIFQFLGSGKAFGCEFTYRVQDTAGGIAAALALARDFVRDDPFVCVLGDNIMGASLRPYVRRFVEGHRSAGDARGMILLKHVDDPERFGVAVLGVDGKVACLVEKPPEPAPSNMAVIGVYMLEGSEVFDVIAGLCPSGRGELEITDLLSDLLAKNRLTHDVIDSWWTDAGTFESLAHANELIRGGQKA